MASAAKAHATTLESRGDDRLLPLEVFVNSNRSGVWNLLERNGELYAPEDAFEEWRLSLPASARSVDFKGQRWRPLSAVPGFEARMNFANQSVELVFSPRAFNATRLTQEADLRPELSPVLPSAFLNYDLSYTHSQSSVAATNQDLGALVELGISRQWGVLTSSYTGRNLISMDASTRPNWLRLETTLMRDFPDDNISMRVGDSSSRGGSMGRSVYFGGLQIGRNFALRPGYITQPIPTVMGMSSAPSTVDIYINDALRQTSHVQTGPFTIDNFPMLTGSGQARMVVRDLLGRETVIEQSFFTHASLLEAGLSDWNVDLGAIRRNLGVSNADYGAGFVGGLWRRGLSKSLTMEGHAEASSETQGVGLGLSTALPFQVLGQFAIAVSNSAGVGRGYTWSTGLEQNTLHHGLTLSIESASRESRQLGMDSATSPSRRQVSASYTYSSRQWGSLGLGLAQLQAWDQPSVNTLSLNYTVGVGERSALTLTGTRLSGAVPGTVIGLSLIIPLENMATVASSLTHRAGQTEGYLSASKPVAAETGTGWRVMGGHRSTEDYSEGGIYYQGSRGLVSADLSASAAQQTLRLGAQGGVVAIDGHVFATRRVQDSFALVEVPGYANVGVGFQGSSLTRTDSDGLALLPRLMAYQRNSIRLDPSELPISAEIDNIEQTAVPAARSGVKVSFPVRSGRGALIKLLLDDGEPAPAGADIALVGDKQPFFVARRGEAFVTGLQSQNRLSLTWKGKSCSLTVNLPPGSPDETPRMGPITCSGVQR